MAGPTPVCRYRHRSSSPWTKVPGPFRSGERKFQGANWPGSYWPICSWERIGLEAKRLWTFNCSTFCIVCKLGCTDTSDPRHFGTIETCPKCPDSSALVLKCPCVTGSSAEMSAVIHFLTCDLSKNKQSCAISTGAIASDRPTQRWAVITGRPGVSLRHDGALNPAYNDATHLYLTSSWVLLL